LKRTFGWIAAIVLLGLVGAGGFYGINRLVEAQEEEEPVEKPELVTVAIERGDLIDVEILEGRLGYSDPAVVYAATGGVITWLPEPGTFIERGESLLEIDGAPITLFYGDRPAWRPLFEGVTTGSDVQQLESNLAALGFDPDDDLEIDEEFTEATTTAVELWQADIGLPDDGRIELGTVVFEEQPVRVGRLLTDVGATVGPGAPVFETSSTEREVVVMLDIDRQDLIAEGDSVLIVLPDETETTGTVDSISNVTVADPLTGNQTLEMIIIFDRPDAAGTFEQAVVDIEVVSEQVLDALLVPVEAVLALAEGGYALEIVTGDERRLVAVELGKFADGLVEITGDVVEGELVAVPQ
jgi:peptidoglycan hydrolase-like protein with peptidoglycan-binding domain